MCVAASIIPIAFGKGDNMSDNEKPIDIEVELPPEDKKADDVLIEAAEPAPKKQKKVDIDPQQAFDELQRRLEQEKQARYEAEQRARLAAAQAERAQTEVADTNYHLVESAIETLKREKQLVKQELVNAHAQQDFERIAELQDELAKHNADLSALKNGQKAMKKEGKQYQEGIPVQQMAPPQGDMIDQIAAAVTPRSAAWINANRDSLNNQKTINKMFRAHEDAVDDGIQPDSDEYFRYIENRLGIAEGEDAPQSSRRASPPAAPVSRGGNGTGSRPNVVRLTPEMREMAQLMGMTEQEYAKNLLELQKEGKVSRH